MSKSILVSVASSIVGLAWVADDFGG